MFYCIVFAIFHEYVRPCWKVVWPTKETLTNDLDEMEPVDFLQGWMTPYLSNIAKHASSHSIFALKRPWPFVIGRVHGRTKINLIII